MSKIETTFNALQSLYYSTNGYQWYNNNGWDFSQIPDNMEAFNEWYGLKVYDGKLTCLFLENSKLKGLIPPEIGQLIDLEQISLFNNYLTGSIPSEIGNLVNLAFIQLAQNQLRGEIPSEIGNLTNLEMLGLARNDLTGSIPIEIGNLTNLKLLYLSANNLSGSIPKEIGNLLNLEELNLRHNRFTGKILLKNLVNLRYCDSRNTNLNPSEIINISNENFY